MAKALSLVSTAFFESSILCGYVGNKLKRHFHSKCQSFFRLFGRSFVFVYIEDVSRGRGGARGVMLVSVFEYFWIQSFVLWGGEDTDGETLATISKR